MKDVLRSLKIRAGQQKEQTDRRIFFAILERTALPLPTPQYAFAKPERAWTFDFAWIPEKVALEVEGGLFSRGAHSSPGGIGRDINKYNDAMLRGWRVYRCVPGDKEIIRRRRRKADGKTGTPTGGVEYHVHGLINFAIVPFLRDALESARAAR